MPAGVWRGALLTICLLAANALCGAATPAGAQRLEGVHDSGAHWAIDLPPNWNGTLLLYGRGYAATVPQRAPDTAPRELRDWLLAQGYALAASSYSAGGWSLEEAPRDQIAVLDEFIRRASAPRRTIAWGSSMGALVSLALAERHAGRIHAALPLCGSVSGSLGMLNTALDGAFAFRTLVAPDDGIRVVDVDDDRENAARVTRALERAWPTPAGRARTVLAAVLAQLPTWSDARAPRPAVEDFDAQAEELRKTFVMGVFVPRTDQERRAGGIYGWNTGIDYRAQLQRSGQEALVRHVYRQAGLDLDADLAALNAAPRIQATPSAIDYLRRHFVPSGRWQVPVLTLQTIGDGLTVPATHGGLAQLAREAGAQEQLGQLWLERAGHCTFTAGELAAALATLELRLDTGRWSLDPATVAARAPGVPGERRFLRYEPPALLRHCGAAPGSCPGEPAPRPTGDLQREYVFTPTGQTLPYRVYVPTRWDGRTALPIVLFLHGAGANERTYLDMADGQVRRLAEQHGYIVVSPLGFTPLGAFGNPLRLPAVFGESAIAAAQRAAVTPARQRELALSELDVITVLEKVTEEYGADRTRTFLAGHSMGSGGVWHLAARYPERWRAIAPMSGPFVDAATYPFAQIRHLPILMTEGTGAEPSLAGSRALAQHLREGGFRLEYVEVDGNHGSMVPMVWPRVFAFFDAQSRAQ